jgi:YVTN family beta-propeller protein
MAAMTLGARPAGAAPFAYVTNFNSDTVSVISMATNTVVATIPVGSNPLGVAITPDGEFVYVTNSGAGTVSVISTASNTVVATMPVGSNPLGVAITPDGEFVYVTPLNCTDLFTVFCNLSKTYVHRRHLDDQI